MGYINTPTGMVHLVRDTVDALQGTVGLPSNINRFVTSEDPSLTNDRIASYLRSTSTVIDIFNSPAPSAGQVLTAQSSTNAIWVTPPEYALLTNSSPQQLIVLATGAVGTSSEAARADHRHGFLIDSPVSVGATASPGVSTAFVRADHVHPGLSRDANDFGLFTEKTITSLDDYLIIEDSQDNYNKKRIRLNNIQAAGSGMIEKAQYSFNETPAQLGTAWAMYHTFTTNVVDLGSFRFGWSYEFDSTSRNTSGDFQIIIDGIIVQKISMTPRRASDTVQASGFKYRSYLTSGTHTITILAKKSGPGTVIINRVDFEVWKTNI